MTRTAAILGCYRQLDLDQFLDFASRPTAFAGRDAAGKG